MKPGRFALHRPTTLEEALDLLAEHGPDAKVLAGGQSLMPMLNFRIAAPEHLVDINRLPDLDRPELTESALRVPALVRQRTLERAPEVAAALPILPQALREVAHPQIRNRGTVCGSVAHGDAAAEMPTVMTALDARMHLRSRRGERVVEAGDFFQFHLTTAVEEDEILTGLEVGRLAAGTRTAFRELATRHGDFAIGAVAVVVTRDGAGIVTRCRLVAAGVGAVPVRLHNAEARLLGGPVTAATATAAGAAARREVSPTGDAHASADYRRDLLGVLVRRALADIENDRKVTDRAA